METPQKKLQTLSKVCNISYSHEQNCRCYFELKSFDETVLKII